MPPSSFPPPDEAHPPSLLNHTPNSYQHTPSSTPNTAYDPSAPLHRTPGRPRLATSSSTSASQHSSIQLVPYSFPPGDSFNDDEHELESHPPSPSPSTSPTPAARRHSLLLPLSSLELTRSPSPAFEPRLLQPHGYSAPLTTSHPFFDRPSPSQQQQQQQHVEHGCPVEALEGRSTPFFMPVLGQHDEGEPRREWYRLDNGGEGESRTGEFGEVNGRRRRDIARQGSGESDTRRDSGYGEKANLTHLFSTVDSLAHRLGSLTQLSNSLHTRLSLLESAGAARDREIDSLRTLLPPQQQQQQYFGPIPPPQHHQHVQSHGYQPQPLPHDLQDYPSEFDGGDLTPPASPVFSRQIQPSSFASYSPSPSEFDGGFNLPTPTYATGVRSRAQSVPNWAFEASFPPPSPFFQPHHRQHQQQQQQYSQPLPHPQARLPPVSFAGSLDFHPGQPGAGPAFVPRGYGPGGGFELGAMGRQRAMSVASGSGSSGGGGGGGGARSITLHSRSVSLNSGMQTPGRPSAARMNGMVEQLNYRLLLENDSDIDTEAFVRRILVHNDQQCSLFLQQRVRTTTDERRRELFEAVGRHVLELSMSKFGNFLVSRCLEAADLTLAKSFERTFTGHFLELALDPFGCHVVQKLLDCGDGGTKARVVDELIQHPSTLKQKNAGHVWNRILTSSNPPAFYARLAATGKGTWAEVVKDDGGSLIVQHLVEDWEGVAGSAVVREIVDGVEGLGKSACGSFLLDRLPHLFLPAILAHAPALATDGYGAKLVDKALVRAGQGRKGESEAVRAFVEAVTAGEAGCVSTFLSLPPSHKSLTTVTRTSPDPRLLLRIASHPNGAALLSNLVSSPALPTPARENLVRGVMKHAAALVKDGTNAGAGAGGVRLVGMCGRMRV
ncbi:hypothetical protein JCM8097_006202 [Rhodosporidiobolus ruineniae]